MLETACSDFEALQRLIRQEARLVFANGDEDVRGRARAQMALAKSFVFYVVRARRICEHGAGSLTVDRPERQRFLRGTAGVVAVRDVNEHGFDTAAARGKSSKPAMHHHINDSAKVDETAMVVLGEQTVLMGPLNLHDVYVPTERVRALAGFNSLPPGTF